MILGSYIAKHGGPPNLTNLAVALLGANSHGSKHKLTFTVFVDHTNLATGFFVQFLKPCVNSLSPFGLLLNLAVLLLTEAWTFLEWRDAEAVTIIMYLITSSLVQSKWWVVVCTRISDHH